MTLVKQSIGNKEYYTDGTNYYIFHNCVAGDMLSKISEAYLKSSGIPHPTNDQIATQSKKYLKLGRDKKAVEISGTDIIGSGITLLLPSARPAPGIAPTPHFIGPIAYTEYKVKPGETLEQIAKAQLGDKSLYTKIYRWNDTDPNNKHFDLNPISPTQNITGWTLLLPPR